MLNIKKLIAILICVMLAVTVVGCKKTPDESSEYSVIYITRPNSSDVEDKNTDADDNSSSKGSSSNKNNSSNNDSSNREDGYKDTTNKYRDLKGRKIVFIATWDGTDRATEAGKIIAETEKKLNCTFVEKKTTNYTTFYASILSGNPIADLFCPNDRDILNLAYNNMLTPLDTLPSFDFNDDCWDKQSLKQNTLNGHIYGMSRNKQWRELLIYNKDMFEDNNWSDLFELQKAGKLDWDTLYSIMEKAVKVTEYGLVPLYGYDLFGTSMLLANGVYAVDRVGDTTQFKNNFTTSTAVLNAMNTFKKWVDLPNGLYDSAKGGWDSGRAIFYSGKAAMAIVDNQMISTIDNNANFDWGCVLFPHGPDSSRDLYRHNTTATAIPAGVKNPDDVALFWNTLRTAMKEDFSAEEKGSEYDQSYYVTVNKYFSGLQNGYGHYEFSSAMGVSDEMLKLANGQTTPAAAVESVKNSINGKIKSYWE